VGRKELPLLVVSVAIFLVALVLEVALLRLFLLVLLAGRPAQVRARRALALRFRSPSLQQSELLEQRRADGPLGQRGLGPAGAPWTVCGGLLSAASCRLILEQKRPNWEPLSLLLLLLLLWPILILGT